MIFDLMIRTDECSVRSVQVAPTEATGFTISGARNGELKRFLKLLLLAGVSDNSTALKIISNSRLISL